MRCRGEEKFHCDNHFDPIELGLLKKSIIDWSRIAKFQTFHHCFGTFTFPHVCQNAINNNQLVELFVLVFSSMQWCIKILQSVETYENRNISIQATEISLNIASLKPENISKQKKKKQCEPKCWSFYGWVQSSEILWTLVTNKRATATTTKKTWYYDLIWLIWKIATDELHQIKLRPQETVLFHPTIQMKQQLWITNVMFSFRLAVLIVSENSSALPSPDAYQIINCLITNSIQAKEKPNNSHEMKTKPVQNSTLFRQLHFHEY